MMTQQHILHQIAKLQTQWTGNIKKTASWKLLVRKSNIMVYLLCTVWHELWQLCLAFYCDKEMSGVTLNAIYNCSTVSWTRVVTVAQQILFVQKGWDLARIKHATETHKQIKSRCFYAFSQWQSIFQATLWGSLAYIERLVKSCLKRLPISVFFVRLIWKFLY